jgi:hypothetical protein
MPSIVHVNHLCWPSTKRTNSPQEQAILLVLTFGLDGRPFALESAARHAFPLPSVCIRRFYSWLNFYFPI